VGAAVPLNHPEGVRQSMSLKKSLVIEYIVLLVVFCAALHFFGRVNFPDVEAMFDFAIRPFGHFI
jgi:hypothetical protein